VILTVTDLHFSYGNAPVLEGIDLSVAGQQIVCVVGPNGSGKSTLVKCVDSILKPRRGTVLFQGRDVGAMSIAERARHVAYVPQSTSQLYSSTVFDTVMMGRRPYASESTREHDVDVCVEVLLSLGLDDIALREFNELSGGQQQRVLIARSLAQEPKLLLLDEPTSALDVAHQLEVMEIIHGLAHERGTGVLMVVHDLNLASRFADRIVMLNDGRVHVAGAADQVFTVEHIRRVYGVESVVESRAGALFVLPLRRVAPDRTDPLKTTIRCKEQKDDEATTSFCDDDAVGSVVRGARFGRRRGGG
jgi:iron complex transport system ATP-binding protein